MRPPERLSGMGSGLKIERMTGSDVALSFIDRSKYALRVVYDDGPVIHIIALVV